MNKMINENFENSFIKFITVSIEVNEILEINNKFVNFLHTVNIESIVKIKMLSI